MSQIEYVRVRDTNGEFTTSRAAAKNAGLTVLEDKPAVDQIGRPLPAKPKVSKAPGSSTPKSAEAAAPEEKK